MPPQGPGILRRFFSALTAGSVLFLSLTSCDSPPPATGSKTPVTDELSVLKSESNGLYYQPFLRDEPAGPEDNSYAVRIRRLIGDTLTVRPVAKTASFFRGESLASSPLIGRDWLAPLASAGASGLLNTEDAVAVRSMRAADGWFSAPDPRGPDTLAARAQGTLAALEILHADGGITAADRAATIPWLRKAAASRPSLGQGAEAVAASFSLLQVPVPADLAAAPPPSVPDFTRLSEQARYHALLDAYAYAVVAQSAGRRAELDPSVWGAVLQHNAGSLSYEDLYYAVFAAHAAGAPRADFAGVRTRLAADTLPDGTIRDSSGYLGDSEATLYALVLRQLGEESTRDDSLVKALRTTASTPQVANDPSALLMTDADLTLAGDEQAATSAVKMCHSTNIVPDMVTVDNAQAWARSAQACAEAGSAISPPTVNGWPLDAQHVAAAATLVTGLADSGLHFRVPAWITPGQLRLWALHPERMPSVLYYADVVRAYLIAGGLADAQIRRTVSSTIDPRQRCARLPDLYQADAVDGCELNTTGAVWKLKAALNGHLRTSTVSPSTPTQK